MSAQAQPLSKTAPDDMVAEVAGPPFSPVEASAAIGIGLIGLLISGLMAILLATLVDEHRLTASGIGLTAMLEALTMAVVTGGAGILLRPVRLRAIGAIAAVALVLVNLATLKASGMGVLAVRGAAGIPEGVLLWISIGFISRSATPERWAAVLFTGMGLTQLAAATFTSAYVLPRFGANGGYLLVAATAALAAPVALFLPRRLGEVTEGGGQTSGMPPPLGWIALAGTLVMAASLTAVSVYLIPLAQQAGLSVAVGRTSISVTLAFQMAGGVLATAIAGRVRYIVVFWTCGLTFAATWITYALHPPAWLFIAMGGLAGLATFVAGPFLVSMTVEADPSRRAAMQSGAVQLLAAALGPLAASMAVRGQDVHGVLILAGLMQGVGLATATVLHRIAPKAA